MDCIWFCVFFLSSLGSSFNHRYFSMRCTSNHFIFSVWAYVWMYVCSLRCPFTVHFSNKCLKMPFVHRYVCVCVLVLLLFISIHISFDSWSRNCFVAGFFGWRWWANGWLDGRARMFTRLRVLYDDFECKCDELVFEWNGFGIVSITTTTVISAVFSSYVIGRCFCCSCCRVAVTVAVLPAHTYTNTRTPFVWS